jgi:hypothetical protein
MDAAPTAVPDIAVVVPTRDREQLVGRLLHQLLRLDGGPTYELIVVDEQSTDGTPALLARMAAEHGVRVLRHDPPRGLPGARNAGTAAATARYVAWIDDDDLTSPDRLRLQWEALRATGRRWSCAGRIDVDDDLRIIGHMRCPPEDGLLASILRFNSLPTAAQGLLVERDLAVEVGGYDESLRSAEDWEFCIRLAAVAPPHLLDEPLVGYRTGFASMSTNTARMEESIQAVLDKHAALRAAHGVEPDWGAIHQSLLAADLLAGRVPAARRLVKALRAAPSVRNGLRGLAILAAPRWFERQSAERRAAQVPAWWALRAQQWLADVPPLR